MAYKPEQLRAALQLILSGRLGDDPNPIGVSTGDATWGQHGTYNTGDGEMLRDHTLSGLGDRQVPNRELLREPPWERWRDGRMAVLAGMVPGLGSLNPLRPRPDRGRTR